MVTILAIDNNSENLIRLETIIKDAFPDSILFTAINATKAIELAIAENPDVILLDIFIPPIDGFDICCQLKRLEKTCNIPVVFLSSINTDKEKRIKALEVGAEGFLFTPIDTPEFIAQIKAMVKIKSANLQKHSESAVYRKSEDTIEGSEEKFRAIFENNSTAIAIIEADTTISMVNDAYCEMGGYPREEVIGMSWTQQIPPDDLERLKGYNRRRLNNPKDAPDKYEFTFYKKDGEIRHALLSVSMIQSSKQIITSFIDITERKRSENALLESEQRYHQIFDSTFDAFLLTVPDGSIQSVNPATCKMFGRTEEEIYRLGRNVLIDMSDPRVPIAMEERARTGKFFGELNGLRRDGTKFPVELASTLFKDQNGNVLTSMNIRDITERKRAEEALRASEERLRIILEATKTGIWDWDLKNDRWFATPQYFTMLGYEPEKTFSDRSIWLERVHPDDREVVVAKIKNVLEGNDSEYFYEARMRHDNGTYRWHNVSGYVVERDEDGRITRMLGTRSDIDERKQTEMRLRESEELFRNIFEHHTAVKLIIDPDTGNIIDANKAAESFYGWPKERLKQMSIQEINTFSPEEIRQAIEKARTQKQNYFEFRHRLADGSICDVEVFSSNIEVNGKFLLHSIIHDISRRKLAEKAISISEARLKRAELASKSGNWELHLDTKIVVVSVGAATIYGIDNEQFEYSVIKEKSLPEYRPMLDATLKKLVGDNQPYEVEFKIKTSDTGEIKDIHSIAQYDKKRRMVFGIIQDITERKLAEVALRESEERFEQFMANLPAAVFMKDSESRLLYANLTLKDLLGWHNAVGKLTSELLPPKFAQLMIADDKRVMEKGPEVIHEKVIDINGVEHFFETHKFPFYKLNGEVLLGAVAINETERKQAEEALKENEVQLRELVATKDKFFSIIAHDLKSPFNSILGFSNILAEQIHVKNYEGIEEYAVIIQKSSQRAMDLLLNLLEWSRSQTGRMVFNPEYVEIVGLINQVTELLNDSAQHKSITISKELPRISPIVADKAMISTVLRNLISNAVKFTNPGGKILISAEQKQNELKIIVSDNGVGIKKEALGRLFLIEKNYSTYGTQKEKGTGLGLILCKEFVEKHGGKIWVESEVDKGSKFCFTIPKA